VGGVLGVIGVAQWHAMLDAQPALTQARYLLPLLALYGALAAVVARGPGRRAMPLMAVVLVGLAVFHELSSLVLTIGRYYA
jgi:hypothetical protein